MVFINPAANEVYIFYCAGPVSFNFLPVIPLTDPQLRYYCLTFW